MPSPWGMESGHQR